jgi:outer membrane protein
LSVLLALSAPPPIALEEAYRRALERAPEIVLLQQKVLEAEINVDRAWAILKPQLSASYTFTHAEPPPDPISFPNIGSDAVRNACRQGGDAVECIRALQASLEDPIVLDLSGGDTHLISGRLIWSPLNGRAIPTIANAYDAVDAERERTEAQKRDLLLGVARAYYTAAAAKGAITAAERSSTRTVEQLDLIKARAELGERSDVVVKTAEIAARQAALDLARAKNAHSQALLLLWTLTRSDDRPDVADPPVPEVPQGDRDALLAQAESLRKDLAAAGMAIEIAERAKDEVWWRFAPVVGMFGGYRYSNVQGLAGQNSQWNFGVTASIDLYDGLRYAELAAADARIATALATKRALEDKVKGDLDRALLALEGADLGVERAKEAVGLATQTLDVTQAQFEVGTIRAAELTEANDRVLDAEFGLIRASMERSISVLELRHAIGVFPQ